MNETVILLVEDNPNDEVLTLRTFAKRSVANEIVVVRDGAAALEYVHDGSRPLPSLVLLDLQLPKIGGLDVLRRIRADERTKLLPVIVLTASTLDRDRIAGQISDASGIVKKPVDMGELAEALRSVDLGHLLIDER